MLLYLEYHNCVLYHKLYAMSIPTMGHHHKIVGIRRSLGNAEAMRSRQRSSTAQTKCERLGAGAQIDFATTY